MKKSQTAVPGQPLVARAVSIVVAACVFALNGCNRTSSESSVDVPVNGGQGAVATESGGEASDTGAGQGKRTVVVKPEVLNQSSSPTVVPSAETRKTTAPNLPHRLLRISVKTFPAPVRWPWWG